MANILTSTLLYKRKEGDQVEFAIQNELDIMNKVELTGVICILVYAIAIVLGIEEQEAREMYCIDFSENDIVL